MAIPSEVSTPPRTPDATSAPASAQTIASELRRQFDSGRTRAIEWRLAQLDGIKRMLKDCGDELLSALGADLGKPHLEGYGTEIAQTIGAIDQTRKKLAEWMKPERVSTPVITQPGKSVIHKEPLGVVLIIAPWNYPFALAAVPLVGALAAGNCAVIKPSEISPETSAFFARRLPQYIDSNAIKVVEGGVAETTDLLAQRWDHIFYTGNGTVGRIVMQAAAKHLTPVTLELGGKSPCIVDRDTDLDLACKRIAWGKWTNCGQTCIAPDYVLVHRDVHERFVDKLVKTVHDFYGDDPQRSRDYGRIVNARHHQRLMKLMASGTVKTGGTGLEADRYLAPTVMTDVAPDAPVMQEEIFGPILPVLIIDDIEEAIGFVNARPKPLALYLFSNDEKAQRSVLDRTSSGGVTINHTVLHFAVHDLPFGGVGESGMGAYHGRHSFDTFTHRKAVLKKPMALDAPIMYPPFTSTKEAILKRLL